MNETERKSSESPLSLVHKLHHSLLNNKNSSNQGNGPGTPSRLSTPDRFNSSYRSSPAAFNNASFKVVLLGSINVGKTSLILRETSGSFDEDVLKPTVATETFETKVEIADDQIVELIVFDTVGQERFKTVSRTLYRNTNAILLCFDTSAKSSFKAIDSWYLDVQKNAPQDALILLVGTKIDLVDKREVSMQDGKNKASQLQVHYIETSSKTGFNVRVLFALVASQLSGSRIRAPSNMILPRLSISFPDPPPSVVREEEEEPIQLTKVDEVKQSEPTSCYYSMTSFFGKTLFKHEDSLLSSASSSSTLSKSGNNEHPHIKRPSLPIQLSGGADLSLAEVIVEHASNRARLAAGGLVRRNTMSSEYDVPASPHRRKSTTVSVEDSLDLSSSTSTAFKECQCGALVENERITFHENEECWLRLVPCSLSCGSKFPLLDCMAHVRESCALRNIRCECGKKVKAQDLASHKESYRNLAVADWAPADVVHFALAILNQSKKVLNIAYVLESEFNGSKLLKCKRMDDMLPLLLSHPDAPSGNNPINNSSASSLLVAFNKYITSRDETSPSNGDSDYVKWEEEEEAPSKAPRQTSVHNNKMVFRGNHLLSSLLSATRQLNPGKNIFPPITAIEDNHFRSLECDADEVHHSSLAVSSLWSDLLTGNSTNKLIDISSSGSEPPSEGDDEESTREVLVPLSLGTRVVAVKTIKFTELDLNSQNLLGSGSFGSVYLGRYRGALIAAKRLHYQNAQERDLLREAAVMTSVSGHPHVLRFLGICLEKPNICFVSEALDCSLEEWLLFDKRNQKESLQEIIRFAEEAASGIFHLHLETIVHRDIAARNLMLDNGRPKRVKVCDFGLARVLPRRHNSSTYAQVNAAETGGGSLDLVGPLRWMSPESLRPVNGLTRFSFASDVYSFAITVWELLSRSTPYPMLAAPEAALAVLVDNVRPPQAACSKQVSDALCALLSEHPRVASDLAHLLNRAWDRDPVQRPTMKEMLNSLSLLRRKFD